MRKLLDPLKVSSKSVIHQFSSEHPSASLAEMSNNDKAWGLMYGALVDGLGVSPDNFQLQYPFSTWDWQVTSIGYTSAAQWDFCSAVPQFSATGSYASAGTAFNDTYGAVLNVVKAHTTDAALQAELNEANNLLVLATNGYDTIYSQAKNAYDIETGGSNDPTFILWLAGLGGRSWQSKLDAAYKNVQAQQDVYNQLLSETKTPGLNDAISRFHNSEYFTKFQDSSLGGFPPVPAYSIGMDSTTWLGKVKSGKGGSSGKIEFSNSQEEYDYKKTWAKGSASVGNFFWSVEVGGSWEKVEEFATDSSLEVTIEFEAWDQINIDAGRWYNGAFVSSIQEGPFIRGYSPRGAEPGTKAVWGANGIMTIQKVGMIVCYKPKFSITVSDSAFNAFSEKWKVASAIRVGPFSFSGGGGSNSSGWIADSATKTFSGESTSETPLILGVNIKLINPAQE